MAGLPHSKASSLTALGRCGASKRLSPSSEAIIAPDSTNVTRRGVYCSDISLRSGRRTPSSSRCRPRAHFSEGSFQVKVRSEGSANRFFHVVPTPPRRIADTPRRNAGPSADNSGLPRRQPIRSSRRRRAVATETSESELVGERFPRRRVRQDTLRLASMKSLSSAFHPKARIALTSPANTETTICPASGYVGSSQPPIACLRSSAEK